MNNIYQLSLPIPYEEKIVHVYIIEADVVTLVDAGINTTECWEVFCSKLSTLGFSIDDIKRIVLTHHHPDHCGLLDYFPRDIEIVGHYKNNNWISQNEVALSMSSEYLTNFINMLGVPVGMINWSEYRRQQQALSCNRELTKYISEGDTVAGFRVLETPGHASSHISLYREEDGILIGGDMLLEHITPNPIIEAPEEIGMERPKSLLLFLDSLQKLKQLPITKVLPGHGEIFRNVHEIIDRQILLQQKRANKVLHILSSQTLTAFEISKELYPALYNRAISLTLAQTVGQLDYLLEKDLIECKKENGVFLYEIKRKN